MTFTVVSFHAHPDDEALLTSGTLARAVAEGHRVVLVVATSGEAGLADTPASSDLGRRRAHELAASARAIGAARVILLGHPDSGSAGQREQSDRVAFADLDKDHLAAQLAEVLVEERADVLTTYDAAGGYGHPDHVQVHRVGLLAAGLARTPVVLEATIDRERLLRASRLLRVIGRVVPMPFLPDLRAAYTPRDELTHRIDVRPHLEQKLAALRAHASQASGDGPRTLALLLRLPPPLRRRVLGTEWFREVGRVPGRTPLADVFTTLRASRSASSPAQE